MSSGYPPTDPAVLALNLTEAQYELYISLNLSPDTFYDYVGGQLFDVAIAFIVLSTFFVGARFFARYYIKDAPPGWDDYLIIPGYIMEIAMCAGGLIHVKYAGVGYHVPRAQQLYTDVLGNWGKTLYAIFWFWNLGTIFPRLAILALYLRIFSSIRYRIATYILGAFIVAYGIAFQLVGLFICTPVNFLWSHDVNGHCINIQLFFQLSTLPLIIADIPMLLLPIPQVWALDMTRNKRIGVILTFMTGVFGLVASCLRLAYFITGPVVSDYTWASASIILWTIIEPGFYLIAACLIALRPVIAMLLPEQVKSFGRKMMGRPKEDSSVQPGMSFRQFRNQISHRDVADFGGGFSRGRLRGDGFGVLSEHERSKHGSRDPMRKGVEDARGAHDISTSRATAFVETVSTEEAEDEDHRNDDIEMGNWRELREAMNNPGNNPAAPDGEQLPQEVHVKKEIWVTQETLSPSGAPSSPPPPAGRTSESTRP